MFSARTPNPILKLTRKGTDQKNVKFDDVAAVGKFGRLAVFLIQVSFFLRHMWELFFLASQTLARLAG
jgi:hypothetical protein